MWTSQSVLDHLYHLLTVERTLFTSGCLLNRQGRRCSIGWVVDQGELEAHRKDGRTTGSVGTAMDWPLTREQLEQVDYRLLCEIMHENDKVLGPAHRSRWAHDCLAERLRKIAREFGLEDPARMIAVELPALVEAEHVD